MSLLEKLNYADKLSKKQINKLQKRLDNIDLSVSDLPVLNYPIEGSEKHLEELDNVKFHVMNKSFAPNFLELSDAKPEKIFKKFVRENNLKADYKKIADLCEQLDALIMYLKLKYNRLRPKDSMLNLGDDFPIGKIRDSKSPSYPSGHTAMAYFIADIIAKDNPEARIDLTTIADMIAQSRIDNGLHYPSDLMFGRYLGELAARSIVDNVQEKINEQNFSNHNKILNDKRARVDLIKNNFGVYTKEKASQIAEFIKRSNEIERYFLNYHECLEASSLFLQGFPIEYCTDNKYIRSHLDGLACISKTGHVDNVSKLIRLHESLGFDVLERGSPGLIRNFSHSARSGVTFPEPEDILSHLDMWFDARGFPFVRHAFYEWVHPFCDGNGRTGRLILAKELDFDFEQILQMIGDNYLSNLIRLSEDIQRKFLK